MLYLQFAPSLFPITSNHWPALPVSVFLRISRRWIPILCNILRLAAFTLYNAFWNSSTLCTGQQYLSFSWRMVHILWTEHSLIVPSLLEGCLVVSYLRWLCSYKHLCSSFCANVSFSFSRVCTQDGTAVSHGNSILQFVRNCQTVFRVAVPFYIPITSV